ncbi:MAG: 2-phosphosulfolactate phosphatase [Candidatus Zixiibacteriota bacterium]
MRSLKIYITYKTVIPDQIQSSIAFVADILRASNTIITAFANGAKALYPAESPDLAIRLKKDFPKAMLCGERKAKILPGFDLGNSPFEYEKEIVSGKELIFASTNGSKALLASKPARKVAVSSFANLSAALELAKNHDNISIVCSGVEGRFALEDFYFAGYFAMSLARKIGDFEMNDQARVAKLFAENNPDILETIKTAHHAKYLDSIGYSRDIEFASQVDKFDNVPIYKNGAVKSR